MSITNETYTSPDWTGYAYPDSLAPLPDWMIGGLSALTAFSLLSAITSATLLSYITYLFIAGGAGYRVPVRKNQYVILIYCLLIADLQLAMGFLISFKWIQENQIYAPSAACIAQAWLTNLGDLASGLFVLAIAAHTFLSVVFRRRLESFTFWAGVIGVWIVAVIITAVPIMLHASDIFTGGSWCSINSKYNSLRLYCHYLWVFLAEFLVVSLYALTFIILRHRMSGIRAEFSNARRGNSSFWIASNGRYTIGESRTDRQMSLAATYMILYPVVYIIVTLPLAAGRIATMAGNKPPLLYLVIGGSFMTSAGWIDCLLYSLTRRAFLAAPPTTAEAPSLFNYDTELAQTGRYSEILTQTSGSSNNIRHEDKVLDNGVKVETTWEVRTTCEGSETNDDRLQHRASVMARGSRKSLTLSVFDNAI